MWHCLAIIIIVMQNFCLTFEETNFVEINYCIFWNWSFQRKMIHLYYNINDPKKMRLVTELIELCLMPFSNTFSFYNGLKVSDKTDTLNIIYSGTCHQIDTIKHWFKMKDFPHSKQLLKFYYIIKEGHLSLGIGLFQPVKTIHISVPDEGYSRNNTHISSWWRLFQKQYTYQFLMKVIPETIHISVPDECYSRNVSCPLNLISTFLFSYDNKQACKVFKNFHLIWRRIFCM
jgi:hypothetical protein